MSNLQRGSVLDKMIRHSERKEGTARRAAAVSDGQWINELFTGTKKLTSGILIKNSIHWCNDPGLYQGVLERERKKERDLRRKSNKEKRKLMS